MSIFKAVNLKIGKRRRANLSGIIKYVLKDEKTEEKLIYGQCLEIPRAYKMMIETKQTFQKEKGREYYHYVQSYPPTENITPEQALEQAKKFLEETKKFRGFEVLVAVHKDREHIHCHYIVNSVSFVDGHKFHISRNELEQLKQLQNNINIRDGYSPAPEKYKDINGNIRTEKVVNNKNTYQLLNRAEKGEVDSYVQNCAISVLTNIKKAKNKNQFIELMEQNGFSTAWLENKKHITFTDIKREKAGEQKCKIRLAKLADYYPEFMNLATKEELINVINANNGRTEQSAELNDIREQLKRNRMELDNQGTKITDRNTAIANTNTELADGKSTIADNRASISKSGTTIADNRAQNSNLTAERKRIEDIEREQRAYEAEQIRRAKEKGIDNRKPGRSSSGMSW